MSFSRTQQQEAYKKLSSETQNFIMLNETTDSINLLLKNSGLEESALQKADSEILYAMIGLQSLDIAIENIAKNSDKTPADFVDLKSKLKSQIFDKLEEFKNENSLKLNPEPTEETLQSIPEDKREEQEIGPKILVEVPKQDDPNKKSVNLIPPPKEEEEVLLEPPKPGSSPASLAPSNPQPQNISKPKDFEERKKAVPEIPSNKPHYPGGIDPYREPLN